MIRRHCKEDIFERVSSTFLGLLFESRGRALRDEPAVVED